MNKTSFDQAFANARKSGLKSFQWNGKKFTTELASKPSNANQKKINVKQSEKPKEKEYKYSTGSYSGDVDKWALENPESVFGKGKEYEEARRNISPDVWKKITSDLLQSELKNNGKNQTMGGNRINMTPQLKSKLDLIPRAHKGDIVNRLYSKDADVLSGVAASGIGGAAAALSAGVPYLSSVIANPITSIASAAGSYAGGKATDVIVDNTTKYNNWGEMISDKTGVPSIIGDLSNPGTWVGAGIPAGVQAIRNIDNAAARKTINNYNSVMGAKRAEEQAAAKAFNANSRPTQIGGNPKTTQVKVNGKNTGVSQEYGAVEGKGFYKNPYTGVNSRISTTYNTNTTPQVSYHSGRGSHLNTMGGSGKSTLEQWADIPEDYVAWDLPGKLGAKSGYVPVPILHDRYKPVVSVGAPIVSTINDDEHRYEKKSSSWGDPEFVEWFRKQIKEGKEGTVQNFKGKPINIKLGGNKIGKREIYATTDNNGNTLSDPVNVPDSTTTYNTSVIDQLNKLKGGVPSHAKRDYNKKLNN